MLFERRLQLGIADGSLTVAFRRWKRSQVVAGHEYRTGAGMVQMDSVDVVEVAGITPSDARRAGYRSVRELLADLRGDAELPLYRLRFHRVDHPDPRQELAATSALSPADVMDLDRRLDRLDRASPVGPWTAAALTAIATRPGVRAADLASSFSRELLSFKKDIRKLKALGLTISLEVGYRLSPRGDAYLAAKGTASWP